MSCLLRCSPPLVKTPFRMLDPAARLQSSYAGL